MEPKSIIPPYKEPTGSEPVGHGIPVKMLPEFDPDHRILGSYIIDMGNQKVS